MAAYQEFLTDSPIPKLVLDVTPGLMSSIIVPGPDGVETRKPEFAAQVFPNTTVVAVEGGHFAQEDSPERIGDAIDDFVDRL